MTLAAQRQMPLQNTTNNNNRNYNIQWLLFLIWAVSAPYFTVNSFSGVKVNSLSDRLMGSRCQSSLQQSHRGFVSHTTPSSSTTATTTSTSLKSAASANNNYNDNDTSNSRRQDQQYQQKRKSTKRDQESMVDFINEIPNQSAMMSAQDADPLSPLDADTMNLVNCIVHAADGRKASDIVALKVHHISTLSSVLVILSGNSRPQNQAIASVIKGDVQEQFDGQLPGGSGIPEGSAESGWMLLDYGAVMVHIMTPKSRLFYNVQGQWEKRGAVSMDISQMLIPNPVLQQQQQEEQQQVQEKEEDPFWS
mmetsp:Transcript_4793/g.6230  ORF Transcript_4793/g.6230 Transcript_4793/m.6230 type:complete len:307 (-) Transcript_4793:125-1045(-)|eukprot:CAMPEP_0198144282 /NCGR_PEP_ID=MMETSP1443-20131203/14349_1 /TAXON_ID=186043 /ORGANISM="Entomoneis sp., Strain CCMP2396" /LENGTH=306 /DNA_ID=CAMNT_0043807645 /DNA_START=191 /DNA_END=1111 /DNA_ORIENTATION=-